MSWKSENLVFTDGSCNLSKNTGGFAVYFATGKYKGKEIIEKFPGTDGEKVTNIRMEGLAIMAVLKFLSTTCGSDGDISPDGQMYTIVTDSKFWIDMITKHMHNWSDEKFQKQANPDITVPIFKLYKTCPVKFEFVRAHQPLINDDSREYWFRYYNNYVDKRAMF